MLGNFTKEYVRVLERYDGDMFQVQMSCFDRVLRQENLDPLFLRGMEILRLNPVFLVRVIAEKQLGPRLWEAVRDQVDVTAFRDAELAEQTFILSLLALVMSMTDAMARPERTADCRRELLTRLDILTNGSLKQEPARGERV